MIHFIRTPIKILRKMLKYSLFNKSNPFAIAAVIFLLSSCVTQRQVEYLQNKDKLIKNFTEAEFPDYRLKPNDELYIQIHSLDEGAANIFSNAGNLPSGNLGSPTPYSASLISYSIDKDGYLMLPVIGKILAKEKTVAEVSVILRDSLYHVLNQPIVTAKLVNRYVSVLGEVRNPGHFIYSQEKLSVFDALGLAGDITDYANPDKIIIIRNENGENILNKLSLTSSEILASELFYLRPNDIMYVKPLNNKVWRVRQIPLSLLLSALTTGLLIYEIINIR